MATTYVESIADIVIPDTQLVRDVTGYIREAESDLLFDHSRRVLLFGALQGRRRGLQPDFKRQTLQAFADGNKHRPRSTFGNVNADVLEHCDDSFAREDFVQIILDDGWRDSRRRFFAWALSMRRDRLQERLWYNGFGVRTRCHRPW